MEPIAFEELTPEVCYRAGSSRDPRFDGRFFTAVKTTGIYCRPICPARPPKFENCRYFFSAAAAQEAGFRPCLRCRPEVSPEFAFWRGTSNTVSRAMTLINDHAIDPDSTIEQLADRLGVGARQLRRLFHEHLGASPISVMQTRRILFAKQLIHETQLPMSEVALASGFGSIRRFNDTFHKLYHRPPSTLRRASQPSTEIKLQLAYRPPYDWDAMLGFLAARAIPRVEWIENGHYFRSGSAAAGSTAIIEVANAPGRNALEVRIEVGALTGLMKLIARVRRVFDVAADPVTIGSHLSRDPTLAQLVARRPGLRSPGGWDEFELAVRAVLGQQVSVAAARTLAGRLVELTAGAAGTSPLLFPTAAQVASADLEKLGMPATRRRTLKALAEAAVANPNLFERAATLEESVKTLCQIPGIGEWTAQYIALRALREPDAFPASDLVLLKVAANGSGTRPKPAQLLARAEAWRPWRAYAAQHLWNS
ncbi:MAG TPA: AlkA N-terminal domain-containing protein [Bryobacteraceae bacterium]|jgi:AraC family transcriptional regulator of adaptative response / DNA-3-methyladenine glycosylase II